jgi:hypothetical protein
MYVSYMIIEYFRPAHRGRISIHVDEEKHAEWNNSRQLVQLTQNKSIAKANRHSYLRFIA